MTTNTTTQATPVDYVVVITPQTVTDKGTTAYHFGAPVGGSYHFLGMPTNSADAVYNADFQTEQEAVELAMTLAKTKTVKFVPPAWMRLLGAMDKEFVIQKPHGTPDAMTELAVSRVSGTTDLDDESAVYNLVGLGATGSFTMLKENITHREAVKAMVEYQLFDKALKFRQPFSTGFRLSVDHLENETDGFPWVIQLGYRMSQVGQVQKFRTEAERKRQIDALVEAFGITNIEVGLRKVFTTNAKVDLPEQVATV